MAVCSASGKSLPPLVIFPSQHVQTFWKPETEANASNYPWIYANKSGWMDSSTFFKWFKEFEERTKTFADVYI